MQHKWHATEVAEVEHQMKDDHGDDGHTAPAVDLPEAVADGCCCGGDCFGGAGLRSIRPVLIYIFFGQFRLNRCGFLCHLALSGRGNAAGVRSSCALETIPGSCENRNGDYLHQASGAG